MRRGIEIEEYLDDCLMCFKCNHRCPVKAKPSALMLERARDIIKQKETVPLSVMYMTNGMAGKGWRNNVFRDVYKRLSDEEKKIIIDWSKPKQGDDLLWCGCGSRLFPYDIEKSKVLGDIPKFGGINDCCGLYAARSGRYEIGKYVANNLIDRLSKSGFKRLVSLCGSCQEMFEIALPEYIGQEFPFKVISVYEYIDELVKQGKVEVKRKLNIDAAISDSCHGPEFGDRYLNTIKKLSDAIGIKSVQLEHCGKNNACCGAFGIMKNGSIGNLLDAIEIKGKDIKKSGKKDIVSYCQGCFLSLDYFHEGNSHYLLEKLLWALGDEIKYPQAENILGRFLNRSSISSFIMYGPSFLF